MVSKELAGWPEYYITDEGEIYRKDYRGTGKPRRVKPCLNKVTGYLQVNLCENGKRRNVYIHRAMAETFLPNPDNLRCVDHINRCRTDNRLCNIRWVDDFENARNKEKYVG